MKRKILACILTLTMIMGTVPNGSFSVLASDFEPLGETTAIDDGYWEETEDVLADGETTGIIEDEQDDPAINTDNETVSYNASTDDPGEESLIDVQSSDSIFDELSIPQEYEDEISQEEESDFSLASNDGNDEQDSEEYCTVTWDANGGKFFLGYDENDEKIYQDTIEVQIEKDNSTMAPYDKIVREGYTLQGWSSEFSGGGSNLIASYRDDKDRHYYAIWSPETPMEMQLGQEYSGTIEKREALVFQFIPEESGIYAFRLTDSENTIYPKYYYVDADSNRYSWGMGYETYGGYFEEKEAYQVVLIAYHESSLYSLSVDKSNYISQYWNANGGIILADFNDDGEPVYAETYESSSIKGQRANLSFGSWEGYERVTREGYILTGWTDQDGNSYGLNDNVYPEEDTTFTAIWTKAIKITWDANGGQLQVGYDDDEFPIYSETYEGVSGEGEGLYLSTAGVWGVDQVTKEGYVITGWTDQYGNKYGKYDEVKPEEDTTFTAIWTKAIKITWDANGGQLQVGYDDDESPIYSETYERVSGEGERLYLSTAGGWGVDRVTKEGYVLTGWIDQYGNTYGKYDEVNPKEDTTYTAIWTKAIKITWNANGGQLQVGYDDDEFPIYSETYEGVSGEGEGLYLSTAGVWGVDQVTKEGYVITGWTDQYGNKYGKYDEVKPEEDTTFTAIWTKAIKITWDANGGQLLVGYDDDESPIYSETYEGVYGEGEDLYLGSLRRFGIYQVIREGYALTGWTDQKGNKYDKYDEVVPEEDMIFYPVWEEGVKVTWDLNGGNIQGEATFTDIYAIGREVYINRVINEPDGKALIGWTTEKNDESTLVIEEFNAEKEFKASEETTLYALWDDAYIITWDGNGGHTSWDDDQLVHIEKWPKSRDINHTWAFDNENEELMNLGWSTSKDAKDIVLSSMRLNSYQLTGDTTLYAIWVPRNGHTIWQDSTETIVSYNYPEGFSLQYMLYADDVDENIRFIGWSTSKEAKDLLNGDYQVKEDMTVYAIWSDQIESEPEPEPQHTVHTIEILEGKAATCKETGLTEGSKCSVCGEILVPQKEIPVTEHTVEKLEGKNPTCTESGLTEGKRCSVCGEVLEKQQEIPALGHTPETVPSKVPTCKETGLTEGSKCSVCGVILVPQEEIPVTEHTVETLEGKDPTCTETGLTDGKRCSVCGEVLEEQQEIPALGHTSETIPGKAATSIETGLTEGERCSVCGEILTSQEIIEKLTPTMTLNVSGTLLLKKGQTSKAVTVSELAAGDSVKSVKSSNKKVLKVSCKNGTITLKALNKIGTSSQ